MKKSLGEKILNQQYHKVGLERNKIDLVFFRLEILVENQLIKVGLGNMCNLAETMPYLQPAIQPYFRNTLTSLTTKLFLTNNKPFQYQSKIYEQH